MMVKIAKLFLLFAYFVLSVVTCFVKADNEEVRLSFTKPFYGLQKETGPQVYSKTNHKMLWIEQKLDHFNKSETRTWKMRFMADDTFFAPGGPLFIVVGGEWPISVNYSTIGLVSDMAKAQNGYLLYTEHRFYGESRPVSNMTNENMIYLDAQQALADLAHFIRTIKAVNNDITNSKVILAGNSYSASLVIWFMKLYPDLAAGGWASSAPLLAKANFKEYKEMTGQTIRLVGGDSCYNRIKNGIQELEQMLAENRSAELKSSLNICNNFDENNDMDVGVLFSLMADAFSVIVINHKNDTIQESCKLLLNDPNDFKGFTNFIVNVFNKSSCMDYTYKTALTSIKDTFGNGTARQWYYQTCNEFGWYPTTASTQQPFGTKIPLTFFNNLCKDAFGDKFTPEYMESQVKKTNDLFGGSNPHVENVFITYGQLDPWRQVGIQNQSKANFIPMISHCSDLDSISDKDSKELKALKTNILELVNEWLED